jgi:hypothetical protein
MKERETIIAELWKRIRSVSGINRTGRNPAKQPSLDDLPWAAIYELGDLVEDFRMRGNLPAYKRRLTVIVETYINGTMEGRATEELGDFIQLLKIAIYTGGPTLGGTCSEILEADASQIIRPPIGGHAIGIGIAFDIKYTEHIENQ